MKVGLVFAKIDFLRKMEVISNEHIGLGYIANSLEKNGINYEIIDGHFFDMDAQEIINWIEKGRFNVLGFSVLYSNYEETIKIINTIKKNNPTIFIYLGGQHVSFCPEDILLENKNIDAILLGEGEFTTVELIQALKHNLDFGTICGLVYRNKNKIISNGWRKPLLHIEDYGEINREVLEKGLEEGITCSINIMAGRGCIFNCSFCTGNKIFNPYHNCGWRVKQADAVIQELSKLVNKYKKYDNLYEIVNFCDLNFVNETSNGLMWLDEFTRKLQDANLDIFFYIMTRVDSIVHQKNRIIELRKCGLVQIEMGLEAGNEKGLSVYNKHISTSQSYDAVRFLREQRIDFGMSGFIMYHPYIKLEDLRQNAVFLKEIEYWKVMFLLTKMALYPGSEITDKVKNSALLYDTYRHYEVYDYRFEDDKVELLYNALGERLPFTILNDISESIIYLELQLTLVYRKIEKMSDGNKELLHRIEINERKLKNEIRESKDIIFNFFMGVIELVESNWDLKVFDSCIAQFSLQYTKKNEVIVKEYEKYSIFIKQLIEELN